ncbi:MAG: hypothetical protein H8M99_10355 [Gloeobacteraceae cyanobacterium ES-bin-144]|nr:hypothetical protein [Verrucomicrobiales bacterium]
MSNISNHFSCTFHNGTLLQSVPSGDYQTNAAIYPRSATAASAFPLQERPSALAEQKTTFREGVQLQPMPCPMDARKTPAESDVSIGPLLTGITMMVLIRRHRH